MWLLFPLFLVYFPLKPVDFDSHPSCIWLYPLEAFKSSSAFKVNMPLLRLFYPSASFPRTKIQEYSFSTIWVVPPLCLFSVSDRRMLKSAPSATHSHAVLRWTWCYKRNTYCKVLLVNFNFLVCLKRNMCCVLVRQAHKDLRRPPSHWVHPKLHLNCLNSL